MPTSYESRYAASPDAVKAYDTQRLRDEFLIPDLMTEGEIRLTYTHYDRFVAGGAVPTGSALTLEAIDPLKADFFLERRELGVINVGGAGTVTVDGEAYAIGHKEALYVGRGARDVSFASDAADRPARFYLNSAPAHAAYPTKKVTADDAEVVEAGAAETSNKRTIRKLLVSSVVDVCQLQMGMTELASGSVWNTMPAHTHDRRMEVYFYFDVAEGQAVCHFMGPPDETRHLWVHDQQAVISPPWSVHAGAGTGSYTFIWGMAGENLDYGDMDVVDVADLR
ncbi:5-dehydro-4-deoxy-D-glucuronate isomerase [Rubrivirga sp. S365]|uniref:4-deoxy-L-threo-5-hexosulose-uronate ketol-isomerase n=1 Tax=Rubrivirga litoralis TaxID=3075598 RepID=A0ABU3BNP2_9BACT|nr:MULTISPECIES: 5-dehydro-4-deoxy-D-glucuronate isomerase [unclassified Rubrivirga]MDT0630907.1 5-dehydro-4-deoxy-D-glucuronate isomerase [Rubrivirga sp. F394]MDT7856550.1 5-dehydro-4-deoxy-D-glucuronate isomerase [Rubrivirga sp. S365]